MVMKVVQQIDAHGAEVRITRRQTDAGVRADQVTIVCPPDHPTGITTTLLQAVSASMLRGDESAGLSLNEFVATLSPTDLWLPGRRNTTTDELLTRLADVYMQALAAQQPPLQVVTRWLGSSVPTASTLIREARRRQLIKEVPRPGRPMKKN